MPLFPVGGSQSIAQCSHCGYQIHFDSRALAEHADKVRRDHAQRAITLYNSLRNSPANSITLNELMTLYGQVFEYDQAISAARDFPQALEASEQAMTTLGRIHLAKADHANALRWFDAAIARNFTFGEAHYYRAVAHLGATPPDLRQAVASARSSRAQGYAGADDLLREAESRLRENA